MSKRLLLTVTFGLVMLASVIANPRSDAAIGLPEKPTAAQVESYVKAIESRLKDEEANQADGRLPAMIRFNDPKEPAAITRQLHAVPAEHIPLLCKMAARSSSGTFRQFASNSLLNRTDFRPEHRDVLIKYIEELPAVITVLDDMAWFDMSDGRILKAFKHALLRKDRYGGLDNWAFKFAGFCAARGHGPALVAVADTIRIWRHENPQWVTHDLDALRQLVVVDVARDALPDYILTHRNALVFESQKRVWVAKSIPAP